MKPKNIVRELHFINFLISLSCGYINLIIQTFIILLMVNVIMESLVFITTRMNQTLIQQNFASYNSLS